jgi:hypothetical protein
MRLTIASLRRVVKGDLAIQFVPQALTSYGGLELLRRYLRRIDLAARLRHAFVGLPSDYGSARLALMLLALFYVGARRLEHLRFLSGDPLVTRFCGLARLPTRRTVANWLRQFTQETPGGIACGMAAATHEGISWYYSGRVLVTAIATRRTSASEGRGCAVLHRH